MVSTEGRGGVGKKGGVSRSLYALDWKLFEKYVP